MSHVTRFWSRLLWALVFPQRRQRIAPTVSGAILIVLSLGLGVAAYNAANNILFITLSLLLACLIISGVLSWLNVRGLDWTFPAVANGHAGKSLTLELQLRNAKTFLPTYGLWFEFAARPLDLTPARAESTITGRGLDLKRAWNGPGEIRGRVFLRGCVEPQGIATLDWSFTPPARGCWAVEVAGIGSLFPFGFLRKQFVPDLRREILVRPAPALYRRDARALPAQAWGDERALQAGSGSNLRTLRRYAPGDSHRLIHWKASARQRQLLVRQFSAEADEKLSLWLRTDASLWPRREQFELMLSLTATLTEDLARVGKLAGLRVDAEPPLRLRGRGEAEAFLDRLAIIQPAGTRSENRPSTLVAGARGGWLVLLPEGIHGVAVMIGEERFAVA